MEEVSRYKKLEDKREEIKSKTKRSGKLEDFKRRVSLTSAIARYVSKGQREKGKHGIYPYPIEVLFVFSFCICVYFSF